MEFSLHNPGAKGQKTNIHQTVIFQGDGSRRPSVIEIKGKGGINSHLENKHNMPTNLDLDPS